MIRHGFVDLAHGQVHFRYAGHGPPVLLLHDSPRSSAMHTALIEWLADEFTAIALDTPGYGYSAPLPGTPRPEIADFARALAATQTALGIERCAIYGFHTSSKILLQLALDHPERIALGIIDGLNLPPGGPGEEFIARYMKPLPLENDGSHLAAGWSRAREFMRFFPWFDTSPRARLPQDFPDDTYLHGYALDLLTAGPHFSDAYSAAMRYLATPLVSQLRAPMVFMCRSNDPLYVFLDSLPKPLPNGCRIERLGPERDRWQARLRELFRSAHVPNLTTIASTAHAATAGMCRRYRQSGAQEWHLRTMNEGQGRPILLLHDVPGSSAGVVDWLASFATLKRPLLAVDLPGCGATAAWPSGAQELPSLEQFAQLLTDFLESQFHEPIDVVTGFSSGPLALAAAARSPGRIRSVLCDGLPYVDGRLRRQLGKLDCPPLVVSRDGGYLLAIWHQLRDRELHWPWFERAATGIRRVQPRLETERMHGLTLDVARQLPRYGAIARAVWAADWRPLLKTVPQPVLVLEDPADPRLAASRRARRQLTQGRVALRPAESGELPAVANKFWQSLERP